MVSCRVIFCWAPLLPHRGGSARSQCTCAWRRTTVIRTPAPVQTTQRARTLFAKPAKAQTQPRPGRRSNARLIAWCAPSSPSDATRGVRCRLQDLRRTGEQNPPPAPVAPDRSAPAYLERATVPARLLLLARHLLDVKLELLALQDVTVAPAALAGAGRNRGQQTARVELGVDVGVHHLLRLTGQDLLLHLRRLRGGGKGSARRAH